LAAAAKGHEKTPQREPAVLLWVEADERKENGGLVR